MSVAFIERSPSHDADVVAMMIERSPDLVCTHDLNGRILSANPAACTALGYPAGELAGMNLRDILTDHACSLMASYLETLVRAGRAAGRMEILTRGGDRRVWEYSNVVLDRGEAGLVGGMARDITDRLRTFQTLYESESHFRALVEHGPDITGIISADGTVCYHSPAAVHALHYLPQELIGTSIFALVHPDDRGALADVVRRECERAAVAERIEVRLRASEGVWRSFELMVKPIERGRRITGLLLNARDVTERKMLEQQLEQAKRVDSLGRLAATVAHEFNNVLMGMMPFAELLQKKRPTPELVARATQHILNSIQRGKRVTYDILRYTQRAEPLPEPLALADWWSEFIAEAQVCLGDNIRLTASIEPLTVVADANQLSQVISNLIGNARDAMRSGGELSIAARAPRAGETFAFGCVPDPSRFVQISVADTGCGMPPEVLRHIFEPLFTTKANGGTGLGLAVSHQVIARHGGYIFAESVAGAGSTFHIFLPKASVPRQAAPEARPPALRSRRLLLVDDEELIAGGLAALLDCAGMETVCASSGAEALRLVETSRPDVVLLDVGLPDADGSEVAREIQKRCPGLPILLMTGHGDVGGETTLRKPFEVHELLERIALVERKS